MKKLSIITMTMLLALGANAQIKWGLTGGLNLNNQLDHYQGETVSNQIKMGVHAGVIADIAINGSWSVRPSLLYSLKGGQQDRQFSYIVADGKHDVKIKSKNSLHYLEVPLNIVYKIKAGNGKISIGAGPYIGVLVSAYSNYSYKNSVNGVENNGPNATGSRTLHIGDESVDDVRRFDFGLNTMIGYEMNNGFFLRGGMDMGLASVVHSDNLTGYQNSLPSTVNNADVSTKNLTYMFGIGYMWH